MTDRLEELAPQIDEARKQVTVLGSRRVTEIERHEREVAAQWDQVAAVVGPFLDAGLITQKTVAGWFGVTRQTMAKQLKERT